MENGENQTASTRLGSPDIHNGSRGIAIEHSSQNVAVKNGSGSVASRVVFVYIESTVGEERSGDRKSFIDTLTDLLNQYGRIGDSDIEYSHFGQHKNDCGWSITDCFKVVTLRGSSSGIESTTVFAKDLLREYTESKK